MVDLLQANCQRLGCRYRIKQFKCRFDRVLCCWLRQHARDRSQVNAILDKVTANAKRRLQQQAAKL